MKLQCTSVNELFNVLVDAGCFMAGGSIHNAEAIHGGAVRAVNIFGNDKPGSHWVALQEGDKYVIKSTYGDIATFKRVDKKPKFAKVEKRVDNYEDKRRYRRVCRQYDKVKFTDPAFYCPIAAKRMLNIARNHKR